MKILLLDNHDSFTFNLVELLRNNGKVSFNVVRSDELHLPDVENYDKIIFSPGPGLPEEQPAMFDILREYAGNKPILGICLGHQAIALHYGGELFNLPKVVHGQPRSISIIRPEHYIFHGIPDGAKVGLYHSWAVAEASLPPCLDVIARSKDGTVMGLSHLNYNVCGLQFHPESIITTHGQRMLDNWISEI
ncbi:MAG: aminodeoxychorismate/anthranilate synthase component II [Bacteroidetes bacterium]|nr:aminodeoxychorismate/anthranilate synthase component II [Bacteroidota bacterium]